MRDKYRVNDDEIDLLIPGTGHYVGIEAFSQRPLPGIVIRVTNKENVMTFIRINREGAKKLIWELERALRGGG